MIPHTAQQLAALKDSPRAVYCLEFNIGSTTYAFTNSDRDASPNYLAGFLDGDIEIEITSAPKINDIDIELNDADGTLATAFLSGAWMNQQFRIEKQLRDKFDEIILTKVAFEGLLSDISIDTEASTIEQVVSSIWSDYEKVSGIKTNPKSQQRYYPNDTAFEHAANAKNKIYWGREAPGASNGGGGGGGNGSRFNDPPEFIPQ